MKQKNLLEEHSNGRALEGGWSDEFNKWRRG
jgi:hypothetical protein